jgi:hypothetical protein
MSSENYLKSNLVNSKHHEEIINTEIKKIQKILHVPYTLLKEQYETQPNMFEYWKNWFHDMKGSINDNLKSSKYLKKEWASSPNENRIIDESIKIDIASLEKIEIVLKYLDFFVKEKLQKALTSFPSLENIARGTVYEHNITTTDPRVLSVLEQTHDGGSKRRHSRRHLKTKRTKRTKKMKKMKKTKSISKKRRYSFFL